MMLEPSTSRTRESGSRFLKPCSAFVLLILVFLGCDNRSVDTDKKPSQKKSPNKIDQSPFKLSTKKESTPKSLPEGFNPRFAFKEIQNSLGIHHTYVNGARGQSLMVETIGGGNGWIDYDNDGRWDLYFNQAGDATAPVDSRQPSDQLYRATKTSGYKNVTDQAWIQEFGYSQGVAIADYDNDGFQDIFVTNVGADTLFHNQGDGTFVDVTTVAGVGDVRWGSSAAWADLDRDGDLDLYVCNYAVYDPLDPVECRNTKGELSICHPKNVEPAPDACFFNMGDGTFEDQSQQRGLFGPGNRALGVAVADFNDDTFPDIFVANDTTANFLFINDGKGYFTERAALLGCAVDRAGASQANMGLAVGDFDGNLLLDVYATHYEDESNTLYANYGSQGFQDVTGLTNMHQITLPMLGFGTVMSDVNYDGFQDILVANGHVDNSPENLKYRMRQQLLTFDGRRWHDVGTVASDYFSRLLVGRGISSGDIDDDGDMDFVISHQLDEATVLRNDSSRGGWLKVTVRCRSKLNNRTGIGTRTILTAGKKSYIQELCGGTSYASAHQPMMNFGVGGYAGPCSLKIRWPNGKEQTIENVQLNQSLVIDEPMD